MNKFKSWALEIAEIVDAWRLVPRIMVVAYSVLIGYVVKWYMAIETFVLVKCDSTTLEVLLNNGLNLEEAQRIACVATDVVGGPTTAQTALVTAIVGLSTAIFGFYVNSGRRWITSDKTDGQ